MPLTAAIGPIAKAEQAARDALAACAAVQTWLGAANATEALERLHLSALPPPAGGADEYTAAELVTARPFALVYIPDRGLTATSDNTGTQPNFRFNGEILVDLEQTTPEAVRLDNNEAHRKWTNTVGDIIDDLIDQAGTSGAKLSLLQIDLERAPSRNHPRQWPAIGDCQFVTLRLAYGTR